MQLFFLRHGKAHERSAKFQPDSKRPLTPDGIKAMRKVARGMRKLKLSFDLVLTSPYVRAAQTAQIAAEVLGAKKVLLSESLIAEADGRELIAEINESYGRAENILLVGHEPYMSHLLSVLLTGKDGLEINLKKAGLAKISLNHLHHGKCARLEWLLTPKQLERMAG